MGMNMNYKSNQTFFKPKRLLTYLGGILAVFGIPMFFIAGGSFFPVLPFVVVGGLMIVINRELNVKDSDVEEEIGREVKRLEGELEDKYFDVKKPFPKMMITTIGDYVKEGEGLLKRRASSIGKYITSSYHVAVFGFKGSRLYVLEEKFSTVYEDVAMKYHELKLEELDRIDYGVVAGSEPAYSEISLYHIDGTKLFTVPAPTDYTTERFVSDSNDIFKRHREEAAANAGKEEE